MGPYPNLFKQNTGAATLIDYLLLYFVVMDGFAARKLNQCTAFGAWFDVVIDLFGRGMLWSRINSVSIVEGCLKSVCGDWLVWAGNVMVQNLQCEYCWGVFEVSVCGDWLVWEGNVCFVCMLLIFIAHLKLLSCVCLAIHYTFSDPYLLFSVYQSLISTMIIGTIPRFSLIASISVLWPCHIDLDKDLSLNPVQFMASVPCQQTWIQCLANGYYAYVYISNTKAELDCDL